MHNVDENYLSRMKNKKKEVEGRLGSINELRHQKDMLVKRNNELSEIIDELKTSILNSKLKDESQRKRILDLSEVIKVLENKISDLES